MQEAWGAPEFLPWCSSEHWQLSHPGNLCHQVLPVQESLDGWRVNLNFYPVLGVQLASGTSMPWVPTLCLSPGRDSLVGSTSPYLQAFQCVTWCCSLRLAHILAPLPRSLGISSGHSHNQIYCWLYWGGWKEPKPTPRRQTQSVDRCLSCPVRECVWRGGEEDAVLREQLGAVVVLRKSDEESSPCSPALSGPRCSRGFLPVPAGNCAAGQESSQDFPGTHPRTLGNQWWLNLHPSIPSSLPGPTG